jgi:hypothetical protein
LMRHAFDTESNRSCATAPPGCRVMQADVVTEMKEEANTARGLMY